MNGIRERLEAALAKPQPDPEFTGEEGRFDPWSDVIQGIYGCYASESDDLMLSALRAVRDGTTFTFIADRGFAAEFAMYVLAGHGLTNYGTSPRGGWPDKEISDLWQPLIDKWEAYAEIAWRESKGDAGNE